MSSTAPSSAAQAQRQPARGFTGSARTLGAHDEGFTPVMRDRQARGEDPYKDDDDDDDDYDDDDDDDDDDDGMSRGKHGRGARRGSSGSLFGFNFDDGEERGLTGGRGYNDDDDDDDEGGAGEVQQRMRLGQGLRTEPFEDRERRAYALSVLDSPEQLMMFAQSANDSITSQRRRFSAILAGFEPLPAGPDGAAAAVKPGAHRQSPAATAARREARAGGRPTRLAPTEGLESGGEWAD